MKRTILVVVMMVAAAYAVGMANAEQNTGTVVSESLTAQVPAEGQAPTLTAEQQASLENRILKMEQAARDLSPEAIGKAIEELMKQRQQVYQQIANDLNTYSTTLNKPGFNLTRTEDGKFVYVKAQ
jgi:Skp family chaperone for outer membrane proteins